MKKELDSRSEVFAAVLFVYGTVGESVPVEALRGAFGPATSFLAEFERDGYIVTKQTATGPRVEPTHMVLTLLWSRVVEGAKYDEAVASVLEAAGFVEVDHGAAESS